MNDELYEYINKKKQSVVKQYDLLLERIQLSKNPKSAIALMCDEEFIVREPQYPIHPEIWDTASKMREKLIDFYRHKSMKGFLQINYLMFNTYYERRKGKRTNPFAFCKQCITTVYYMKTGLLDRLNENYNEYEAAKEKYEKEKLVFDKEQEEAKELKEKADEALKFFKEIGWNVRYKGILLEDGTMYL